MGLFAGQKSYIGVDIGTSGVKMVELAKSNKNISLITYGFSEPADYELSNNWQTDIREVAKVLNEIIKRAGIVSRSAVAALPTFSVFSSILNLNVEKKDLASAVNWEAKKVIPLPLEEMSIDWVKISGREEDKKHKKQARVLLTAAPRSLVERYINIFKLAQINLLNLEPETLSLVRSLLGNDKSTVAIVEVGATTTDISIIENSIPVLSRSIDVGGLTITKAISRNLNIGLNRAEQFKYDLGISSLDSSEGIPQTIIETIAPIINEIRYIINLYQNNQAEETVEKIILSGGASLLINFARYVEQNLNIKVLVGDPWHRVSYPPDLEPVLKELGPRLAVAVGLALREME